MTRHLSSLLQDEQGTSLIEMGIALPILCALMLGMVDVSVAYSDKISLEQSAYRALEKVQAAGYTHSTTAPNDLTRLEDDGELAAGAGSTATAAAYLECRNGTATPTTGAFNGTCSPGWTAARYVSLSITKTHTPSFGGISGTYTLTGQASIRVK